MSDDASAQPKKLTVEDLVLAQRKTQKALEDVVERLDLLVDRESVADTIPSAGVTMFRVFGFLAMVGCWFASSAFGPTPVLIAISFILFAIADSIFDFPKLSAREQDKRRRVKNYWAQRDADLRANAMQRRGAQFARYQARIKSAIASSRWFPTNWR